MGSTTAELILLAVFLGLPPLAGLLGGSWPTTLSLGPRPLCRPDDHRGRRKLPDSASFCDDGTFPCAVIETVLRVNNLGRAGGARSCGESRCIAYVPKLLAWMTGAKRPKSNRAWTLC